MTSIGVPSLCLKTSLLGALVLCGFAMQAQPTGPLPPREYRATIRYQLSGPRVDRLGQFASLKDYLQSLGFRKDASEENEAEDPRIKRSEIPYNLQPVIP